MRERVSVRVRVRVVWVLYEHSVFLSDSLCMSTLSHSMSTPSLYETHSLWALFLSIRKSACIVVWILYEHSFFLYEPSFSLWERVLIYSFGYYMSTPSFYQTHSVWALLLSMRLTLCEHSFSLWEKCSHNRVGTTWALFLSMRKSAHTVVWVLHEHSFSLYEHSFSLYQLSFSLSDLLCISTLSHSMSTPSLYETHTLRALFLSMTKGAHIVMWVLHDEYLGTTSEKECLWEREWEREWERFKCLYWTIS